jgi:hypothetical protein
MQPLQNPPLCRSTMIILFSVLWISLTMTYCIFMSYLIVLCLVITKLIAPAVLAETDLLLSPWMGTKIVKKDESLLALPLNHPSANTAVMANYLPSLSFFSPLCVRGRALSILARGGYGGGANSEDIKKARSFLLFVVS